MCAVHEIVYPSMRGLGDEIRSCDEMTCRLDAVWIGRECERQNGEIDCPGEKKGANNNAPFPPENGIYLADSVKADFGMTIPAFLAVPELDTLDDATLAG